MQEPSARSPLTVVVGIATLGRREILSQTLELLSKQTHLPRQVIVCPASAEDVDLELLKLTAMDFQIVSGPVGMTAQRNAILRAAPTADIIVFIDDDFLPSADFIANIASIFEKHPDVVGATGRPIMDGVNGPGISVAEAQSILSCYQPSQSEELQDTYGTYGCNMAFRLSPIRRNNLTFDEGLPLYGWQEDIDFSRTLAPFGRIVESRQMKGVHLGNKRGRTSGIRFGYSQVANPIYLVGKGTMSFRFAISIVWRNIVANLFKSIRPEPWIDRRGRLRGNIVAIGDFMIGRVSPDRIIGM